MRHKSDLIETDYRILNLLAKEREYRQYDMDNRLKTTYRTVTRRLAELETIGLVKVARRELSRKGGKRRKVYALTFKGVVIYLASFSIDPIRLFVIGAQSRKEAKQKIEQDLLRYRREALAFMEFIEFYGKHLDYVIFKEIYWLVSHFPMRTESPILTAIPETARFVKSYISNTTGFSDHAKQLRMEVTQQKKQKKRILKWPRNLRVFTMHRTFGGKGEEIEVDFLAETERKLEQKKIEVMDVLKLEDETWRLMFAEEFFKRISIWPTRGSTHHGELFRYVQSILDKKEKYEVRRLKKAAKLFA